MRVLRAALALSLCGGTPLVAQGRGTVALVNANVVPMDRDTILAGQTVLIRDGIIQQVGPSGRVRIPAGTTRVDAAGKYLRRIAGVMVRGRWLSRQELDRLLESMGR